MRILMLSWRGPGHPRAGGAEAYTHAILAGLTRRGHQVAWLCEQDSAPAEDGVRLISGGSGVGLYLHGARFLRAHAPEFDVVVDQINGCGFLSPLYSPIPVLALIHQRAGEVWQHDGPPLLRWAGPCLEGLALRPYRRVPFITVSATTLTDLRAHGWTGRGRVAYNGVAVQPAPVIGKEDAPTLVFLARLDAHAKRLPHALAAHAIIRRTLPDARLWVIGRGRSPAQAPEGVTFFSDVSDARRDELLARSWLLIATSVREGWGRMVLEAAAVGTPCAVYGAPGLAEAAAAVEGAVVAECPEALARIAGELLRAPKRLQTMGLRAMGLAGQFTWSRAVDVWEAALDRLGGRGQAS